MIVLPMFPLFTPYIRTENKTALNCIMYRKFTSSYFSYSKFSYIIVKTLILLIKYYGANEPINLGVQKTKNNIFTF